VVSARELEAAGAGMVRCTTDAQCVMALGLIWSPNHPRSAGFVREREQVVPAMGMCTISVLCVKAPDGHTFLKKDLNLMIWICKRE
jgi:hypothetical protein